MNKQELAEQIEAILSKTDTCFGDCDNVKECSHTGHGCYLWKQYANEIVEAIDAPAKEVEAISDSEEVESYCIPEMDTLGHVTGWKLIEPAKEAISVPAQQGVKKDNNSVEQNKMQ
jgi:hypothetical protein